MNMFQDNQSDPEQDQNRAEQPPVQPVPDYTRVEAPTESSPNQASTPPQPVNGQTPQAPNGDAPRLPYYPTGAPGAKPSRSKSVKEKSRLRLTIVPVLVSILLTFSLTVGTFYTLYAQGILTPLFENTAADPNTSGGDSTAEGIEFNVNSSDPSTLISAQKLAAIMGIIKDNYYEELTDKEILDALSVGLAAGLDSPYTYYLTAEEFASMQQSMEGSYSGIGATVGWNVAGYNEIIDVTPDGPAEEAGVLPGDIPVEVNGTDVQDFQDPSQLAAIVRGPEGSEVEIMFYRPSESRYVTIKIERRTVITVAVTHKMLTDKIGYLRITSFINDLLPQFQQSMEALIAEGAEHIVFDLRNNPGGSADSVVNILDYLLPEGEIARYEGRSDGEPMSHVWQSDADYGVPASMRYAVLMNNNSASASELFAGSLRDWEKAVIVGETSYGKGSGTMTWSLGDGSALNVTIFEYILPAGGRLEGVGLTPDFASSLDPEDLTVPLARLPEEDDNQLQDALDYFNSGLADKDRPAA